MKFLGLVFFLKKFFCVLEISLLESKTGFSDAAKYSYAALCSLALKQLYSDDVQHHEFAERLIKSVRHHLGLPAHSDQVMLALFRGEGAQSGEVYVDLVKREGHAFTFLIVKDLVYHAVRSGKSILMLF